jgi:LmbE family N-acetylglucosaminyl deacetylase
MPDTAKNHPFLGKRIVVFTAHPDDEQLAAGTMYENYKAGGETFLICATAGEKGKSHLKKPVSDAVLKKIRRNELTKAAKILHVKKVFFLPFPDANVRAHGKALFAESLPLMKKINPEYILSFGPDGISAHWDHITVGAVALRIAKKLKVPMAAFTLSGEMREYRRKMLLFNRKFGSYADLAVHRKGDIKVPIDPAVKAKAFKVHKSQFVGGGWVATLPKKIQKRFFGYEHFVREKI